MNLPVPQWLINLWTAFGDAVNVWIWRHGRHEVRRIDILMVIMLLTIVAGYWAVYGWPTVSSSGAARH
jgi:hypothetical protein